MSKFIEKYGYGERNTDVLGIDYLSNLDLDVCSYVSDQLSDIDIGKINYGRVLSFDELVDRSIEELRILGDNWCFEMQDIMLDIPIYKEHEFTTFIKFPLDYTGKVLEEFGFVEKFIIPSELYELFVICFSHEHIHALKDRNYKEYQSRMILGEVITIFFELIATCSNEMLKRENIRFRLQVLLNKKYKFSKFDDLVNVNNLNGSNRDSMYLFLRSREGVYLNSFYYAIILYSMYKENQSKILDLVNKVLRHEMTTLDMLKYLDIYGGIRGEVFEKELGRIRKLVK